MSINAAVTAAVAALQAAIDSAGTLQNAPQAALSPIVVAATAALAAIDAQVASIEPSIDETAVGGIHVGMAPQQMAITFAEQASGATDLSQLETLRGYVGRVLTNVSNAPG